MRTQTLISFYASMLSIFPLATTTSANYEILLEKLNNTINFEYLYDLRLLLTEIAFAVRFERCLVIITDDVHHSLYTQQFFERTHHFRGFYVLHIDDAEDMYAPNYGTVKVLKQIQASHCDLYFITLFNGLQVKRFLKFIDRHRVLNMQQRFVFIYDARILEADMLYIWTNMISSVFLRASVATGSYHISTVAFPGILNGAFVVTKRLREWRRGNKLKGATLFPDKAENLRGVELPIAVFTHIPMVRKNEQTGNLTGLEIEIVQALSNVMNFKPKFYETFDSEKERWGRELPNRTFTGLLGQVTNRSAKIAIGDLHMYKLYYSIIDFSVPHSYECLTFLTPESSQDDTWKTLIQPFSGYMWLGVLLSLFVVGLVFYTISFVHAVLMQTRQHTASSHGFFVFFRRRRPKTIFDPKIFRDVRFRSYLNRFKPPQSNKDLFDNFSNCILYTYSMLMYVSLPRMPRNWPLRVLTGWYWLYCILLAVTYRASFIAILANPTPRITIDTLDQLLRSHLTTSAWGKENKDLFEDAFDQVLQDIGANLEITDDIESIADRIAAGQHAYYDNIYYLRYLRSNRSGQGSDEVLHIMRDCVIRMPVALGLEKNSPLKTHIDTYLLRMREGGLITKWLRDAVMDLKAEEQAPPEALMDLRKFWSSFIALAVGYMLGVLAIIAEQLHFVHIVQKHPLYDEYNTKLYYNFKRKYPNA